MKEFLEKIKEDCLDLTVLCTKGVQFDVTKGMELFVYALSICNDVYGDFPLKGFDENNDTEFILAILAALSIVMYRYDNLPDNVREELDNLEARFRNEINMVNMATMKANYMAIFDSGKEE